MEADREMHYYGGFDVGRVRDQSVIIILIKEEENWKVVGKKIMVNTPFKEQLAQARHLLSNYKFVSFAIDQTGMGAMLAETLLEEYHEIVKPITFTNENKGEMMMELKRLFETKKIVIPDDIQLINALHFIQRKQTPLGIKFEADKTDETGHSDSAWALALGVWGFEKYNLTVPVSAETFYTHWKDSTPYKVMP
jgi:phage FluMu gp28-like protein